MFSLSFFFEWGKIYVSPLFPAFGGHGRNTPYRSTSVSIMGIPTNVRCPPPQCEYGSRATVHLRNSQVRLREGNTIDECVGKAERQE